MDNVSRFRSLNRKPLPKPAIVTKIYGFGIFGICKPPSEYDEVTFWLQRSKRGTIIYLKQGSQTWSLSAAVDRYPKSFKEARVFVKQIAAKYGWPEFEETLKLRTKSRNKRND